MTGSDCVAPLTVVIGDDAMVETNATTIKATAPLLFASRK